MVVSVVAFMVPAVLTVAILTHLAFFVVRRIQKTLDADYERRCDCPTLPPYLHYEEFKRDLLDGLPVADILERCRGRAPERSRLPTPSTVPGNQFVPGVQWVSGGAGGSGAQGVQQSIMHGPLPGFVPGAQWVSGGLGGSGVQGVQQSIMHGPLPGGTGGCPCQCKLCKGTGVVWNLPCVACRGSGTCVRLV